MTVYSASDDVISGGKSADTIEAGDGNDIVNSGAGDDVVDGGEGNDQINAGSGDDILIGGAGDDVLNGGGGSDTFRFTFVVEAAGTTTLTYDPVPLDYDAPSGNPNNPNPADGQVSQSEFAQFQQDYEEWLDANAPADYEYNAPQDDPLTSASDPDLVDGTVSDVTLTNGQTRYWESTIEVEGGGDPVITSSEGNDTITSFQDAGPNVDTIEFFGLSTLTDAQLDALFDLELVDTNNDGTMDATRLVWDGGSIQIGGTTEWDTDVVSFFHDDQVSLL